MVSGVFAVGHDGDIAAEGADPNFATLRLIRIGLVMIIRVFIDEFAADNIDVAFNGLIIRQD